MQRRCYCGRGWSQQGTGRSAPPGCPKPRDAGALAVPLPGRQTPVSSRSPFFVPLSLRVCHSVSGFSTPLNWGGLSLPISVTASQLFWLHLSLFSGLCLSITLRPNPLLIQRILTEPLPALPRITLSKMRANPLGGFSLSSSLQAPLPGLQPPLTMSDNCWYAAHRSQS